jgi:type IV pilus assembly protein PilP
MQMLSKSASNGRGASAGRVSARCVGTALALAMTVALAGCGSDTEFQDLRAFMDDVQSKPPGRIEPLPPFEQVAPFAYQASNMRSPFEPPVEVRAANRPSGPQVKPDANRPKQYLEQYTIGNLTMVGTLSQGPRTYALVQDVDGGVHRVERGDFMGTDHGRVMGIEEGAIELLEIVPDGTGGWVERARTVSLGGGDRG